MFTIPSFRKPLHVVQYISPRTFLSYIYDEFLPSAGAETMAAPKKASAKQKVFGAVHSPTSVISTKASTGSAASATPTKRSAKQKGHGGTSPPRSRTAEEGEGAACATPRSSGGTATPRNAFPWPG